MARLIVPFSAAYFTLIAVTNTVDLLDRIGALRWNFLDSGNFDYLRSVVRIYHVGSGATTVLLAGALAIESLGAALFWLLGEHENPNFRPTPALRLALARGRPIRNWNRDGGWGHRGTGRQPRRCRDLRALRWPTAEGCR